MPAVTENTPVAANRPAPKNQGYLN